MKVYIPQVISPLRFPLVVVGSKEIPISLEVMIPLEKALSVTVGIGVLSAGLKVPKKKNKKVVLSHEGKDPPRVRSTGPILVIEGILD